MGVQIGPKVFACYDDDIMMIQLEPSCVIYAEESTKFRISILILIWECFLISRKYHLVYLSFRIDIMLTIF